MASAQPPGDVQDSLDPIGESWEATSGYKPGQKFSIQEYASLDAEDESLRRWKENLGLSASAVDGAVDQNAPKIVIHSLSLESAALAGGAVRIQLDRPGELEKLEKNPLQVIEGIEYNVVLTFTVGREVFSGLKYLHVVRRAGMPVDRMEEMIGSYPPRKEPYTKRFAPSEAPSGLLARSGTNSVRSRYVRGRAAGDLRASIIDDDGVVFADFSWSFKLVKA
ncbi:rho GDP dissociation inhibitor [Malassezia sp. CBS 17886]|nr:rho GDP dissociation inhibitor [Malassezia sp. CBS 17886]